MSLIGHTFCVLDTETTGIDPAEHRAVEVAAVIVKEGRLTAAFTTYINPGRDIPASASGVHGLTDRDVAWAPTLEETLPWLNGLVGRADAVVAHNAPFDKAMLPGLVDKPWLDTLRLSRRLFPDLESHSNQSLRYALNLTCPEAAGMPAHRALADAYVTARLVIHLLDVATANASTLPTLLELIADIDAPMVLGKVGFGKHKGIEWKDVPKDYLQWVVRQTDMDLDTMFTAKHYLTPGRGSR